MEGYIKNTEFLMATNVMKIVRRFETQSAPIPDGEIRIKDMQAAADLLGEPIFVSKGELFEKNLLIDFSTLRDRYMNILKEAVYSLDKKNMFYSHYRYRGFLGTRFKSISEHIEYYYRAFYPHSTEEITETIKYEVEELWEKLLSNHDGVDEDDVYNCSCSITEKTFWFASIYTNEFVEALKKEISKYDDEFDEDSGLCYNGIEGIEIDESNYTIKFYAWIHDSDDTLRYRFVAQFYEFFKNDILNHNNIDNDYI